MATTTTTVYVCGHATVTHNETGPNKSIFARGTCSLPGCLYQGSGFFTSGKHYSTVDRKAVQDFYRQTAHLERKTQFTLQNFEALYDGPISAECLDSLGSSAVTDILLNIDDDYPPPSLPSAFLKHGTKRPAAEMTIAERRHNKKARTASENSSSPTSAPATLTANHPAEYIQYEQGWGTTELIKLTLAGFAGESILKEPLTENAIERAEILLLALECIPLPKTTQEQTAFLRRHYQANAKLRSTLGL